MDDSNNNNNNNNNLPLRVSFVYSLKKQIYSVSPNKGDKTRSLLFPPPLAPTWCKRRILSAENFQPDPASSRHSFQLTWKHRRINTSRKYYVSKGVVGARIYIYTPSPSAE